MRKLYIWDGERMVPAQEYKNRQPVHAVHQDSMAPLLNHADNKVYDSKSAFRKATKEAGCIEVGNDLLSNEKRDYVDTITDDKMWKAFDRAYDEVKGKYGY